MNIQTKKEDKSLTVILEGRLDTSTAPQLEECLNSSLEGIEDLSLDLSALDYISSAGLRVLLSAQKRMTKQGRMQITGANETVMEIFEITGFSDILTIL
ncbi:MAG: STAS domain-containing protein [Lachnospiraceae bacterium]|nr:STAS domain-containing protein [Lachnospiraceae bacterium]